LSSRGEIAMLNTLMVSTHQVWETNDMQKIVTMQNVIRL
jgi:hypothetical protein